MPTRRMFMRMLAALPFCGGAAKAEGLTDARYRIKAINLDEPVFSQVGAKHPADGAMRAALAKYPPKVTFGEATHGPNGISIPVTMDYSQAKAELERAIKDLTAVISEGTPF